MTVFLVCYYECFCFSASTLSVLKVASLQPGAILNDAYKEYKVSTGDYTLFTKYIVTIYTCKLKFEWKELQNHS